MRVLRRIYDFITGGSIAAPIGLACAVAGSLLLPAIRTPVFLTCIGAALVASVFERPT